MASLAIRGPIEAAEPFLTGLNASAGSPVTVEIDSIGGSVWAGFQIYTALARHRGLITVRITGLAASMASAVAMAGDDIVIAPGARMMIHAPAATIHGRSGDLRQTANLLDRIDASMRNAYAARSGQSHAGVAEMMKTETWFTADQAVAAGFADRVLGKGRTTVESMNAVATAVFRQGPWARRRI